MKLRKILGTLMIFTTLFSITSCSGNKELTAEILPVKDGKEGIITIVHDDGDLPSATFLKKEFEEKGLVGNFAMIADRVVTSDGKTTANTRAW